MVLFRVHMPITKSQRFFGMVLSVWCALLYAWIADQVNRISMPGVPLAPPPGGTLGYFAGAVLAGGLMGLACTWLESSLLSSLLGGVVGSALVSLAPWQLAVGYSGRLPEFLPQFLLIYLPLALGLIPYALLVRLSANSRPPKSGGFSMRRVVWAALVSLLVIWSGLSVQYTTETRESLKNIQIVIEQGMQASTVGQLPPSLKDVAGFIPNANGVYSLEISRDTWRFIQIKPIPVRTGQDFVVIARYTNGFTLACYLSQAVQPAVCTNYK